MKIMTHKKTFPDILTLKARTLLLGVALLLSTAHALPAQTTAPFPATIPARNAANAQTTAQTPRNEKKFAHLFPDTQPAEGKIPTGFFEAQWPWILVGMAAACAAAALLLRPKEKRAKTPYETAMASLDGGRLAAESAKAYADAVSGTLRAYLEAAHNLPAMERTTKEFLEFAAHSDIFDTALREKLAEVLRLSDAAKFSKYDFADGEKSSLLANAREFIEADNLRTQAAKNGEKKKQENGNKK